MQYSVGTIAIVSIVPNVSPAMIVTAIPTHKISCSNGMTPSMVVAVAKTTGLKREMAESTNVIGLSSNYG